mgnify:FL=1
MKKEKEGESERMSYWGMGGKNGDNTCKGPGAGGDLELPRVAGAEGTGAEWWQKFEQGRQSQVTSTAEITQLLFPF